MLVSSCDISVSGGSRIVDRWGLTTSVPADILEAVELFGDSRYGCGNDGVADLSS